MRVFIEVPLPGGLRQSLAGLGKEIEQDGIKLVRPENMHATLKFIGDVPDKRLGEIEMRLREIVFSGFDCRITGIGVFPSEDYIKVVWAGIESDGKMEKLAQDVIGATKGFGDDERFSAHITIARVKKRADLKGFLDRHRGEELGRFRADTFNLMQSILSKEGPSYSVIASFPAEEKDA